MQVKQDDLEKINHIVARDILLIYPDSNETLKTIPKLACSNYERLSARKVNLSLSTVENLLFHNKGIQ